MLSREQDRVIFNLGRCVQCGSCLAACSENALEKTLRDDGLWEFTQNHLKCNRCFKCIAVCPANRLPKNQISQAGLKDVLQLHLAHASDPEVRRRSSSGGAARALAKTALDTNFTDVVYSVVKTNKYPWAKGMLLREPEEISRLSNSMYLPILVNKNLNTFNQERSIVLIGTTCQLIAAEYFLKKKCKQIFKIAIFCKQQKNIKLTRFIAKRLGVSILNINSVHVEYRGGSWPGQININGKTMDYEVAAALPYGKRLWRVPGCRMCPNPFGVGVDLTLADPWGIDKTGDPGNTLIVVWSERGKELLDLCQESLKVREIDKKLLVQSANWKDIRRKRILAEYYLGSKVSLNIRLAGLMERLQIVFLENILEHVRLPRIAYKILGRFPELTDFFLVK